MFCKNCGSSINDGARFCPKCGTAAPVNQASQSASGSTSGVQAGNQFGYGSAPGAQPGNGGGYNSTPGTQTWNGGGYNSAPGTQGGSRLGYGTSQPGSSAQQQPTHMGYTAAPTYRQPKANTGNTAYNVLVALIASVLSVIGPLLPCYTASAFGYSESMSLVAMILEDGEISPAVLYVPLILGIVLALLFLLLHKPKLSVIGGAIVTVVTLFFVIGIQTVIESWGMSGYVHVSIGIVLWVIGMILFWLAAFLPARKN